MPVVIQGPDIWRDVAVLTGEAGNLMQHLHTASGEALAAAGFAIEARPWRPHVTLARKATAARWPAEVELIRWTAKALHLGCRADEGSLRYRWLRAWTAIGGR
jgi:2'-5' RNA ligase